LRRLDLLDDDDDEDMTLPMKFLLFQDWNACFALLGLESVLFMR
jgi:hypothetical protein